MEKKNHQDGMIRVNESITLKPIQLEDSRELFQLVKRDRKVLELWLSWVPFIKSEDDFQKLILYYQRKHRQTGAPTYCIRHNSLAAGILSLNEIRADEESTTLGYWLGQDFQKRGIMQKSIFALIEYIFRALNVRRINILCGESNIASRRIAEKLNFKQEGVYRKAECINGRKINLVAYGLLKKEFC